MYRGVQYSAVRYISIWLFSTAQYSRVQYSTVGFSTVRCHTPQANGRFDSLRTRLTQELLRAAFTIQYYTYCTVLYLMYSTILTVQ